MSRELDAYADAALRPLVVAGVFETGTGFRFRCPVCRNEFVNDQRLAPVCTGPSWTDDHDLTVMVAVGEGPPTPMERLQP